MKSKYLTGPIPAKEKDKKACKEMITKRCFCCRKKGQPSDLEVLTVLFCTTDYIRVISQRWALLYTRSPDYSLPDMNFSYKLSFNFPLYPQLFNCHHEPSRFNPRRQSSSLLRQRLMPLHKEVQTHELSTGLPF